jgi:dopamine beta-monooxygenase
MKIHQHHIIFALAAAFLPCFIRPLHAQDVSFVFPGSDNEVYVSWLANVSYNKSAYLPSTSSEGEGVAIHWNIKDSMIHLAVVAPATGWAAFGFAEAGAMRGADIIMYSAETDTLVDSYVLDQSVKPFPDECQSWELINSVVEGGLIIFEAKRLLDTGDTQDRSVIDDSITAIPPKRVIAAWGNETEPSYHGGSTARGAIRFFGTSEITDEVELFVQAMAADAEGNFTVGAQDYIIPSDVVTTYAYFCFSRDDLIDMNVPLNEDLHIVGFEPVIDPVSKKYVHHFNLYASSQPWNSSLDCKTEYPLLELAYGWAPGDLPFTPPSNVGGPLGSKGFQSFALEIHYNNVGLDANVPDSSGVRAYYTSIKREFDLGVFQTGDPFLFLLGGVVSPDGGLAQHSFSCGTQCLETYLSQPVTVIQESLHMHKTGVSMVSYHIRNEKVIRQGRVEFFDFDQQGSLSVIQAPFQMYPGDAFQTVCNYDASNETLWGKASAEEMCIGFIYYYPRQLIADEIALTCGYGIDIILPGCNATYALTPDFTSEVQLERIFGGVPASCPNVGNTPTASTPTSSPPNSTSASSVSTTSYNIVILSLCGAILWSSTIVLL